MKKIISVISAMLIYMFFASSYSADALSFEPDFELNSKSGMLINLDTKEVIYEKNADTEQMPASLVDIMTAVVVLENCEDIDGTTIAADKKLYEEFTDYEYQNDLRYADIYDGDVLSVKDYLYALMLTSSCEAANILAYHFGNENISNFVEMMNEKAEEIGASHTVFANPHGLYDGKQVTTARDMALITEYALSVPMFEEIATAGEYEVKPVSASSAHEGTWKWTHSNIIMSASSNFYMDGVKGIKTGNLQLGGRNIISMGSSSGISYLVVLMNADFYDENNEARYYHIDDACKLFEWAFEHFSYKTLLPEDEELGEIEVKNAEGNGYVLVKPKTEFSTLWYDDIDVTAIKRTTVLEENITAPVKKGEKLGEIELKLGDEVIAHVDLVASSNVDKSFMKFNMASAKAYFSSSLFVAAIITGVILTLIYFFICLYAFVRAKKRPSAVLKKQGVLMTLHKGKKR